MSLVKVTAFEPKYLARGKCNKKHGAITEKQVINIHYIKVSIEKQKKEKDYY